uniref:Tudor domain-containing protein n=1 Tax=Macrostomum lignano TaxID=282301 RepID=A0A1I8F7S5_9PLAT
AESGTTSWIPIDRSCHCRCSLRATAFNRPAANQRALPSRGTDILDLPCRSVSTAAAAWTPQADRPMSDWRRLVNQTYQRLVCGDLYHRLQTEGPRQPPLPEGRGYSVGACVAKFSEDGVWYRAEVLLFKEDTMLVYFVDYGNAEYNEPGQDLCSSTSLSGLSACRLQGLVRHPDTATWMTCQPAVSPAQVISLPRRYRSCLMMTMSSSRRSQSNSGFDVKRR